MNPLRILILEDQLNIADSIRESLEEAGHQITNIAKTSDEALASFRKHPPDVVLIDIVLDNSPANGIETAQALLRQRPTALIFLTGSSDPITLKKAKTIKPAAFLFKPFRTRELPIQVEVAYEQYQATRVGSFRAGQESVFLPLNKGHERVAYNEVVLLRAEGAYTRLFHLNHPTPDLMSMNLGYLTQFFDSPDFFKLSRSFLINLQHIERLERNQLMLRGYPDLITIPEAQRPELTRRLRVVKTP